MRLSYRGVQYDEQPFSSLEVSEGEIKGKYRGQDWKYHYPKHIPQLPAKLYRQYRGVFYGTSLITSKEGVGRVQSQTTSKACSVPVKKLSLAISNEIDRVHLENIRCRLERRLQIAREKGDENLVNLLKKESQELALNI